MKRTSCTASLAWCFKMTWCFTTPCRENIRFGRPLDESALTRAVEDAVAAEYIDSLEDGLEYHADIRGANLSGGQRQRLLISRAWRAIRKF